MYSVFSVSMFSALNSGMLPSASFEISFRMESSLALRWFLIVWISCLRATLFASAFETRERPSFVSSVMFIAISSACSFAFESRFSQMAKTSESFSSSRRVIPGMNAFSSIPPRMSLLVVAQTLFIPVAE